MRSRNSNKAYTLYQKGRGPCIAHAVDIYYIFYGYMT